MLSQRELISKTITTLKELTEVVAKHDELIIRLLSMGEELTKVCESLTKRLEKGKADKP